MNFIHYILTTGLLVGSIHTIQAMEPPVKKAKLLKDATLSGAKRQLGKGRVSAEKRVKLCQSAERITNSLIERVEHEIQSTFFDAFTHDVETIKAALHKEKKSISNLEKSYASARYATDLYKTMKPAQDRSDLWDINLQLTEKNAEHTIKWILYHAVKYHSPSVADTVRNRVYTKGVGFYARQAIEQFYTDSTFQCIEFLGSPPRVTRNFDPLASGVDHCCFD